MTRASAKRVAARTLKRHSLPKYALMPPKFSMPALNGGVGAGRTWISRMRRHRENGFATEAVMTIQKLEKAEWSSIFQPYLEDALRLPG